MKRNVVNLTTFNRFFFLNISLDSLCQKNGLTLEVWSHVGDFKGIEIKLLLNPSDEFLLI